MIFGEIKLFIDKSLFSYVKKNLKPCEPDLKLKIILSRPKKNIENPVKPSRTNEIVSRMIE